MEPFLNEEFRGVREYEKKLVELFKSAERKVRSDELLYKLGISPEDRGSTKAINRQLENLERYGLLEAVPGGWVWRG
jgi:hypothetical protein